jgi:hypothetical protein
LRIVHAKYRVRTLSEVMRLCHHEAFEGIVLRELLWTGILTIW